MAGLRARLGQRPRLWWACGALAFVVVGGALTAATGSESVAPGGHIGRAAPPSALPDTARWDDWKDGTAYSIAFQGGKTALPAARSLGTPFTFTTPDGSQLLGFETLIQMADGSFVQQGSPCFNGVMSAGSSGGTPIVYNLTAHFDQYALVAYAHLRYASAADKIGVLEVCQQLQGTQGLTDLDMFAGCEAALTSCTSPVDTAGPAVRSYESAVLTAEKDRTAGAWGQVYAQMSRALTAQYGSGDFASQMNAQADKHGRITAITSITGTPQIRFDISGQGYFTVTETVVVSGGDQAGTRNVTSYYLMESGKWMFWWSS